MKTGDLYKICDLIVSSQAPIPSAVRITRRHVGIDHKIQFNRSIQRQSRPVSRVRREEIHFKELKRCYWTSIAGVEFSLSKNFKTTKVHCTEKDLYSRAMGLWVNHLLPVLLASRGELILHASVVEKNGRALALVGASGAGKSTHAAFLSRNGYKIIADDLCRIHLTQSGVFARRTYPELRLYSNSLSLIEMHSGRTALGVKKRYRLNARVYSRRSSARIDSILFLVRSTRFKANLINPVDAFEHLVAHVIRIPVQGQADQIREFEQTSQLVRRARFYKVRRPAHANSLRSFLTFLRTEAN